MRPGQGGSSDRRVHHPLLAYQKDEERDTMSTEEYETLIGRYFDELSGKEKAREIQDRYIADA